ncbi:MAG: alanine racemase, partial [Thermomicrobiales bacterium]
MAVASAEIIGTGLVFVRDDTGLDTPCLIVDEAILTRNITGMAAFAAEHSVALRPHIKTHKTPEIARLQLKAGAIGLTCAKLGEAEVMVHEAGTRDILLAYPTVGEPKIARLIALMDHAQVTVALDSREAARALGQAMTAAGKTLNVYVEVNTGQDRAGARFGDEAVALAKDLAKIDGLSVVGVMTHEGQANSSEPDQIEAVALQAGKDIVATANAIRAAGIDLQVVSVGSTPAASYTPTVPGVTEMRPGTYVFNDNTAFRYGKVGPENCALHILATVISRPAPDRAVIDAGSKTLTMDPTKSHPGHGYILGHPNATIARISEEHGVVLLPENDAGFEVGDRVEIIPNHVCPSVNLQD